LRCVLRVACCVLRVASRVLPTRMHALRRRCGGQGVLPEENVHHVRQQSVPLLDDPGPVPGSGRFVVVFVAVVAAKAGVEGVPRVYQVHHGAEHVLEAGLGSLRLAQDVVDQAEVVDQSEREQEAHVDAGRRRRRFRFVQVHFKGQLVEFSRPQKHGGGFGLLLLLLLLLLWLRVVVVFVSVIRHRSSSSSGSGSSSVF